MLLLYPLAGGNQLLGKMDPVGLDRLQQLLSHEELEDGGGQARVQKLLSQKDKIWLEPPDKS